MAHAYDMSELYDPLSFINFKFCINQFSINNKCYDLSEMLSKELML